MSYMLQNSLQCVCPAEETFYCSRAMQSLPWWMHV